jgi:hypothetical protein
VIVLTCVVISFLHCRGYVRPRLRTRWCRSCGALPRGQPLHLGRHAHTGVPPGSCHDPLVTARWCFEEKGAPVIILGNEYRRGTAVCVGSDRPA